MTCPHRFLRWSLGVAFTSTLLLALALAAPSLAGAPQAAPKRAPADSGARVYAQKCASCHGARGEGTRVYAKPLAGSRSVGELAAFIARSMPPGKPCAAPEARSVAAYIHAAFYAPGAGAMSGQPRLELARLTVRQYRNALADLIGGFRPAPPPDDGRRGLRAEYFRARRFSDGERVIDRLDPEVRFDFGTAAPASQGFDPHQFSIRWSGRVTAPDTGEYEFTVRTDHSARLWVNDQRAPLIDAWVKSGSDTEFSAPIRLLGGRSYAIRLEFSKSTQGVDDTDQKQGKPAPPAFVALEWRRPKLPAEAIPSRFLSPQWTPEAFVPTTPFPPDDRSMGYERATAVSKAWGEAVTAGALEAAAYVGERWRQLAGVQRGAGDEAQRARAFCRAFAERAFRRPLAPEAEREVVEKPFAGAPDLDTGVKRVALRTLQSPRFLYREPATGRDAYDIAARLSFTLWDSLPDAELLRAASAGELASREQVMRQAERLASDPRAWSKLREFALMWLKVDHTPDIAKDQKRYPSFDRALALDLRNSFEIALEQALRSEASSFRDLMLSDRVPLNGRLAALYGAPLPAGAPFQSVPLDSGARAGILMHPYLLSNLAYLRDSSPIHRGVLLARNLLGRTLAPPPVAVAPVAADLQPGLTTRQRVEMQTKPAACASCHQLINPLGFSLERFDAVGRVRDEDNGKPVDSSGAYRTRDGRLVRFAGPSDLARFLAESEESQTAFVERLFHNLVKQPIRAYGPDRAQVLRRAFASHQHSIRRLMVEIAATVAQPS